MLRKISVVVVDDEPRLKRGIEKLICSMGEEWEVVGTFSSATACLDAYQNNELSFDLLITDVKMPGMDGLTLISTLNETTNFHAIVISGYDDFTFLQTAIREGADDYLINVCGQLYCPVRGKLWSTTLSYPFNKKSRQFNGHGIMDIELSALISYN
ncbi:response regulator [Aquibacillus salsiterrae]|uniref:Response regulator n=1 Tax=Aquibacillus salsiterrae TaxID=2950439 RepID=A0A9X4AHY0_9BACI|nr:response regulator [Aquibacillus salsiterrae]MDC3418718.1 response regulator [Aquibacillus salsiterrae]